MLNLERHNLRRGLIIHRLEEEGRDIDAALGARQRRIRCKIILFHYCILCMYYRGTKQIEVINKQNIHTLTVFDSMISASLGQC